MEGRREKFTSGLSAVRWMRKVLLAKGEANL
jgi:hypothetical protein